MRSFSIEWHEECLKNRKRNAAKLLESAMRQLDEAKRAVCENEFYADQIAEAKKRNKKSFDPDRFMRKTSCR